MKTWEQIIGALGLLVGVVIATYLITRILGDLILVVGYLVMAYFLARTLGMLFLKINAGEYGGLLAVIISLIFPAIIVLMFPGYVTAAVFFIGIWILWRGLTRIFTPDVWEYVTDLLWG